MLGHMRNYFLLRKGKNTQHMQRRPPPSYRGTANEMSARLFEMHGKLAELRQEVGSLFELVLENRSRLDDLENVKRVPTVKRSRRSRRSTRRKRR